MRLFQYILIAVSLWMLSCANPVAPTGGPKDTTPPKLDTAVSTPSLQTNFEKQAIVLGFNEYVQLEEPNRNVVVSPPLEHPLDFTIKGAAVHISFDDEEKLRSNTTYTINMSNAIKDLNEGNPADNIRFVFSTGSEIDSLELSAVVRDAITGDPVEDVVLMLYDQFEDSVIYKQKPFYFAQSAADGRARLQNLKEGTYKIMALEDVNRNLIYDLSEERLAFRSDPVQVDTGSMEPIVLNISREEQALIITSRKKQYRGHASVGFNRNPGRLTVEGLQETPVTAQYKDSLYLWWSSPEDSVSFTIEAAQFRDTLTLADPDSVPYPPMRLREQSTGPSPPAVLYWNQPIDTILSDLILRKDSLPFTAMWKYRRGGTANNQMIFSPKKEYPSGDTLIFLPGSVKGRFNTLDDTLRLHWSFQQPDKLANLEIKVDSLDAAGHYIVRLLKEGDQNIEIARTEWSGQTQYEWNVRGLIPQSMTVELIRDKNQNGEWDPVRYLLGKHPEPIYRKSITNLRANWDVAITLDVTL